VYDVTNIDSFNHVNEWLIEVTRYAAEDTVKLLVGNKCDCTADRVVPEERGKAFADSLGIQFLETSAKDATNVEAAFFAVTAELIKNKLAGVGGGRGGTSNGNSVSSSNGDKAVLGSDKGRKKGSCC